MPLEAVIESLFAWVNQGSDAAEAGLGSLTDVIGPCAAMADAIRTCGDQYNRTRLSLTITNSFNTLIEMQR